ncbi:DUF3888 domain-containing protein [Niallia oryzisoli]|uniref:DUF3888 domain-containing protein n=1 Tax=Niallia oryzisoli TaxID=1737571 RepID=UPI003737031C
MKKIVVMLVIVLVISNTNVNANTINEAETELCETLKLALMNSLRDPVDKAIVKIYKDDVNAPKGLRWDTTGAEILKIKQVYGIGGLYEITLQIEPFYNAHIGYGIDEVVVTSNGELLRYKHLKTYP